MKLTKSFEQGVCLMAILATQAKAIPVSSRTLQRRLPTSMTYSQKLLRKLVVAGIVKSVPGNSGGFALARPVRQISILEVVEALEGRVDSFPSTGLFSAIFASQTSTNAHQAITTADQAVHRIFMTADAVWRQVLSEVNIGDIIDRVISSHRYLPQLDWNDPGVETNAIFTINQKEVTDD